MKRSKRPMHNTLFLFMVGIIGALTLAVITTAANRNVLSDGAATLLVLIVVAGCLVLAVRRTITGVS